MKSIIHVPFREKKTRLFLLLSVAVLGITVSFASIVFIVNEPPVATFTKSMDEVGTYTPVTFNASGSFDSDGEIIRHLWDFGDGGTGEGRVVTHEYAAWGLDAPVTLTVVDDRGKRISATQQIKVIRCVSCGQ